MQVTETQNEGLKRVLKVVIPASSLEERVMQRLDELKATANIRGFRPGKVPIGHLKRLYGRSAMAEVVQKTLDETSKEAVAQQPLKPAYQPDIELSEDEDEIKSVMEGKHDLAYNLTYEVVPQFEIQAISNIAVNRYKIEVDDTHIEDALNTIAAQNKDFEDKGEKAKAADGDRVTISFVGRVAGEEFEGGSAQDIPLELGSGSFIPGFEEQLIGVKPGDEKLFKVTFPGNYTVSDLAGQDAEFTVNVSKIEKSVEAAIDDELARKLGIEDEVKLREMVSSRIEEEFKEMSNAKAKRDVLDKLDEVYSFDLPQKLVDSEFDAIWQSLEREMEQEKRSFDDENTTEEKARQEYRKISERRVRLGLVLGTIGEQAEVVVGDEELQKALMERIRQFPGQEQQVYEHYTQNQNALMELRGPIYEQKVVDHILEKAKVNDHTVSRDEMQKLLEEDDGHDHEGTKAEKPVAKKPVKKAAAKKPEKKATAKKPAAKKVAAKKPAKKAAKSAE